MRGKGKFTHSLAHPGARFFFLFCARRGKFTHSLTGASTAVCGFFFVVCAAGEIHSLTRASGCAFFLFAVCAAVDIHSLTGASGGDSLTHWRVRGRVFFFCSVRGGGNSLTHWRVRGCVWLEQRGAFFFLLRARRAKQKKKTRGAFFFVRHAAGRAKKKLFSRARRAKKKTHLPDPDTYNSHIGSSLHSHEVSATATARPCSRGLETKDVGLGGHPSWDGVGSVECFRGLRGASRRQS